MAIHIRIDDRERNLCLMEALSIHPDIVAERVRLLYGDFVVQQQVTVERKTVNDFALSLLQGRLFDQARRLREHGGFRYLVLEGSMDNLKSGVRPEALRGAMIALTLKFGIPILHTGNEQETVQTLVYIGKQLASLNQGVVSMPYRKGSRKRTVQRRLLQQIPHIGSVRADRLIEQFGSVRAVFNASQEKLSEIEGIGKHAAQNICHAVEESGIRYGN